MKSDNDPDLEPPSSRVADLSGSLESAFRRSALLGFRLLILVAGLFIGYFVIGSGLVLVESATAPANFLSLQRDPVFYTTTTVVGLLLVQSSSSLLLYELLTGFATPRDRLAVLFSFAALGFGGGILRMSLPQTVELLLIFG